jgi:hypothetical protein
MPRLTREEQEKRRQRVRAREVLREHRIDGSQAKEPANARRLQRGNDTAIRLLGDLKDGLIDPLDVTPTQRRACLLLLANGSQTTAELAALFHVSTSSIRGDLKAIREEVGREVREWSLEEVLGQAVMAADKCSAMAMKQNDPGLSWTINRDLVKLLKDLGVVEPAHSADSLTITVESIGRGYEKAARVLTTALDPRLTGVVESSPPSEGGLPALPLGETLIPRGPIPVNGRVVDDLAVPQVDGEDGLDPEDDESDPVAGDDPE